MVARCWGLFLMREVPLYSQEPMSPLGSVPARARVRVSGLYGHLRMQGYEASKVDSRKPRTYIHLG